MGFKPTSGSAVEPDDARELGHRSQSFRFFPSGDWAKFARWVALALVLYSLAPYLWALFVKPEGMVYLGYQTNLDDHMVYAAWMRQAQNFHFLFDNRFTTDRQPGLTVHLFFFVLGVISKILGIAKSTTLARIGFSFLFVMLLARLVELVHLNPTARKLALVVATFGAGFGAAAWQAFGNAYDPANHPLGALTSGRLPIDVWQPEVFVFSSALTNALFMFSLCVSMVLFLSVLASRESWKPVIPGALGMLVMMNVHSYDILVTVGVLVSLLAGAVATKRLTAIWAIRATVIGLGAVPSALWFMVVLSNDPVFQSRAQTHTTSPSFQQIVIGLLPLLVGTGAYLWSKEWKAKQSKALGLGAMGLLTALLYAMSAGKNPDRFFLTMPVFLVCYAVAATATYLCAREEDDAGNLVLGWAFTGLVLPFVPFMFQRKLEMGLVIPWAVLCGGGIAYGLSKLDPKLKRPVAAAAVLVLCSASLLWFLRDIQYIQNNVSSTTMHSVFYGKDVAAILDELNKVPGRKVVAAPPGIPNKLEGGGFNFAQPLMPDLNPVLSGMTGSYTYAGHWSETPQYGARRQQLGRLFLRLKDPIDKGGLVKELGLTYLVVPNPAAFPQIPYDDLTWLGETVYRGEQFSLLKLN